MVGRRGIPAALAALVLVSMAVAPALALPAQTWLVAIGNNQGAVQDVSLLFAERDAKEVAEVLRTEGGVSSLNTVLLLGEDATTVRREILRVNRELRSSGRSSDDRTALIVFYSGHADADALHLGNTSLPFEELRALVESSPASLRLLVVDACRSGTVTRVKGVRPAKSFEIDFENDVASEGVAIITSSAAGESSQESDRLRASFFSHHLVGGLRGAADRDGDGSVTLTEAYSYTYEQTLRSTGRTLDLQHPTYEYDVKGRGGVVLTSPGKTDRATGRVRLADAGEYLIAEQRSGGPIVAEVSPPSNRATLALPANRYFIQQRLAAEYREYDVTVTPGEEVDLAALSYDAVAYDRLVRQRGGASGLVHGLTLIAGGRGEVIDGEGPTPQLVLGYGLDFPWLSVGLRLRGATVDIGGLDGASARRHSEFGVGLVIQRYFDLRWISLSFGVLVEAVYHNQAFDSSRDTPSRHGFGGSFAGIFAAERQIWEGLSLRLEGGPVTTLFEETQAEGGVTVGTELKSPFTWWAAGGLVWRL